MDEERTIEQRPAVAWPAEVEYPDSDGLPMAENTVQCRAIREAMGALEHHYKPGREVGIASDLLLYYRQGDPATSVAPDLMVSFDVRMLGLPSYKLWEVGKPPEFVLEVSSQSSRELDRTKKVELYAGLGVREYFVFDPGDPEDVGDGQDGKLSGYRLWGSKYVESGESTERGRELESEQLGLLLRPEGKLVRFRDPATGKDLPLHQEESQGRLEAERERDSEMHGRQEAERERDSEMHGRQEAERERDSEMHGRREAERERDAEMHGRREAEERLAEAEKRRAEAERRWEEERLARLTLEARLAAIQDGSSGTGNS